MRAGQALSLQGVVKRFDLGGRSLTVLDGIDLSCPAGSFTALIGPSGCGKSTVLRIATGLERADAGTAAIDGKPPAAVSARGELGIAFQDPALLPWRSVADNVALPLDVLGRPRGPAAGRIAELIALVGLAGFERARPGELSGGMRQRVALARALVTGPRILFLDEPFGALDALTRAHLQDTVMEIHQATKSTAIMITHDVDEAVLLSNRIVMMTNGPAATIGEICEVRLDRPRRRLEVADSLEYTRCRKQVLQFLYERHAQVDHKAA